MVARRRFDDLVQLHEDLKKRFRGCVIPFRPGKTIANSSMLRTHSENFLRARAYAIKCYLHKVVQHPEMKESTVSMFSPVHSICLSAPRVSALDWQELMKL